jgi:phosphatidylserine decarboxylase
MSDRAKVLLQYLMPKQRMTTLAGRVAGAQGGAMTTRLIRCFVGKYDVDMDEAVDPDLGSYSSFNDFFTDLSDPACAHWHRPISSARLMARSASLERSTTISATAICRGKVHSAEKRVRTLRLQAF